LKDKKTEELMEWWLQPKQLTQQRPGNNSDGGGCEKQTGQRSETQAVSVSS
jgi:hypothetical protein